MARHARARRGLRVPALRVFVVLTLALSCLTAPAQSRDPAHAIIHLLDYVAVDYSGAVEDGKVKNEDEFKEMLEFTGQVATQLEAMPANPRRDALVASARALGKLVAAKRGAAEVGSAASQLRWALIEAYGVQVAPRSAPNLAAAPGLYQQHCAACHGDAGRGDGPAAKALEPPPANFHDRERMAQRSAYALYNAISLGVAGTSMAAFGQLDDAERWSLAFFVANFAASPDARAQGEKIWKSGTAKAAFPDITNVATLSAKEVGERFGESAALAQVYLRAHPAALAAGKPQPVDFAIAVLADAVAAYRKGDAGGAAQLAVQAYLEGFELVEPSLRNVDASLTRETEQEMTALRELMRTGAPVAEIESRAEHIAALLKRAKETLAAGSLSAGTVFTSAALILLREGLEALLVVAGIVAFLARTGRRDALRYVHAGWIGAIVLGLATWIVASELVDVSGASRELTEGVTALVSSAMLVYVGYWLHSRSTASAWQGFIKERVSAALAGGTLWTMALVSFLAVYREMFETVLFYQALWLQAGEGGRIAFLAGVGAAVVGLMAIAWAIFRYSARLPLSLIFTGTSILMCVLAVILAGKGVAALQEAGAVAASLVGIPAVPLLGIFPTVQGLAAQLGVALLVLAAFRLASRRSAAIRAASGRVETRDRATRQSAPSRSAADHPDSRAH